MTLGDVLKKERERKKLTIEDVSSRLGIDVETYSQMEAGASPAEEWGPRLALIAVALHTPTSRLIAETGKSAQARQVDGQCGRLIGEHLQKRGLSRQDLAAKLAISSSEMESIENGTTQLETYAPLLLRFAEIIDQPIFNLFYPCGLPLDKLTDYR
ncbi:MAG TPA: helix-turn-helix transcriptional regulator [Blastocatellia bacterium]|nr:helix-turn-helix transcriptional regulator [Blastocatellia bacterium]